MGGNGKYRTNYCNVIVTLRENHSVKLPCSRRRITWQKEIVYERNFDSEKPHLRLLYSGWERACTSDKGD